MVIFIFWYSIGRVNYVDQHDTQCSDDSRTLQPVSIFKKTHSEIYMTYVLDAIYIYITTEV